jgi:AcrR family transcriptional regulator
MPTTASLATAPRPEPQQRRSRATRAKLLQAAEALFARAGFEPTTSTAIAARAGVSIGTFYLHFPDKRAAFLAVFERLRQQGLHELGVALAPLPATPDEFRTRLREIVDGVFTRQGRHAGFRRTLLDRLSKDPQVAARHREAHAALRDLLVRTIRAGQRRGVIRPLDAEAVAVVVQIVVEHLASQAIAYKSLPLPAERVRPIIIDMLSRLLLDEPDRPAPARSGRSPR